MESPQCPLCESKSQHFTFSERGYRLLQCDECELFYIDPYPAGERDTYDVVASYDYDNLEIVDPRRHYTSSKLYYNRYYPLIEAELGGPISALDVGCGTGRLLELLASVPGLNRVGLELNAERAAFARQAAHCPIHEVPIEDFQSDSPFDVVFMMNVLSHVPRLPPFFQAVRRLLAPEGKLFMKVGEMTRDVRKSAVHDWSIPDHLHFLGMRTMDVLAERFGLTIIRHHREPLSSELFAPEAWRAPGRSRWRNAIKQVAVRVPGTLPSLAWVYDKLHGQTIFTSLVVLKPADVNQRS